MYYIKNGDIEEIIRKQFDTWFLIAPDEPCQITNRDIKLFLKLFQPKISSKILDFGCGTGRHLHALENLGYSSLFGVDFSSEAIKKAKERSNRMSSIKYFCMPLLEFANNYSGFFDYVVSFDFTISLYPPQKLFEYLKAISDILVYEGRFLAEVWNPNAVKEGKMNRSFVADIGLDKFTYHSKYEPDKSWIIIQNSYLKRSGENVIMPVQIQFVYEIEEFSKICKLIGCTVEVIETEENDISRFLVFTKKTPTK